ncbi:hypothetical protein EKL97_12775 [Flavobacterium sp. LS1P28]|uniref:hypothetical protein n=1 Tax=unclassified Flavobacterium TaxID=196869 RepID=UPI000F835C73|nr:MULTISPECIES: hypothetical protein [unclassified Flavobacterium]RTY67714.1 hypothetical protein EKL95_09545 [Flavobacterium sp. LB2P53]RTY79208.1 hypothetical protein EKL97_12775 [Flavobacterium sp. LS1P28]RTY91507.1 hypothetical protein EKM01_06945 [Flavobacterium sp. RSP46]
MKLTTIIFLLSIVILLNSCASGYKPIQPASLNYISNNTLHGVTLEYKYDLLNKKYAKKETKKGLRLVAVKVKNNTEKDLVFGKDIKLNFESGNELYLLENEKTFKSLKQSPASYLFYLLLSPIQFFTTKTNSNGMTEQTSSTPIGLIIGPGLALGNMIVASNANKKFKTELNDYSINGKIIKKGETVFGLITFQSDNYGAIKVRVE